VDGVAAVTARIAEIQRQFGGPSPAPTIPGPPFESFGHVLARTQAAVG
jgi:hypothetical protein